MVDISSAMVTTLMGMLGVVIGAILSNYVNQKIARQVAKKDIVFKKKIDYFEKIVDTISKNTKLYKNSINRLGLIKNKRDIANIYTTLKKDRRKFEVMNGPLYMDTHFISVEIRKFVAIEKIIFRSFDRMQCDESSVDELGKDLKLHFKQLETIGSKLIVFLRQDLTEE